MNYLEVIRLLSEFDLGALLVSQDDYILEANEAADRLLHGGGTLRGRPLREVAPPLCEENGGSFKVAYYEYLAQCPPPKDVELPANTRLVCFRDASFESSHHMLKTIINLIREPIVLTDEEGYILLVNNALMQMESQMSENVVGKHITEAYTCVDGNELTVPLILENRQPYIDWRQIYTTENGKTLDIVCNSYPIFKDGNILGVFCLTADISQVSVLNQRIIDLQEKLLEHRGAGKKKASQKGPLSARYSFENIIHQSKEMDKLIARCRMIAKSDSPVMIYGETGTGKELLAHSIHNASDRANEPFLTINCAAIPENLLESMLFGTEKGAYTGAERRPGLFEQADGGTLLLDELNSMSMVLQAKLLRILQDGVVRRVGGTEEKKVDVRVLSSMNIPPYQAIEENKLRQDIFYRLGVAYLSIPPLRKRKDDIPILTRSFFVGMNRRLNKSVEGVDDDVMTVFHTYDWPGNVRELQHCIEHAMNILPGDATVITRAYLPEHILEKCGYLGGETAETAGGSGLEELLAGVERAMLTDAIIKNRGNISKAARQLNISRQNLQHRLKRNDLDVNAILEGKETGG